MNLWWKPGIVAAAVLFVFNAGGSVKGKFDEAAQAEVLREQIKADHQKQDQIAGTAKAAEADLALIRQKYITLNQRWSAIRAKSPSDCKLPDDRIGLLKDATGAQPQLPR